MNVQELLKGFTKRSKKDDVPGTVEAYLEEKCPNCGAELKLMKPCCGSPKGRKECRCGYKVQLT